jgi:GH24 family phage-related lysozyme (muramidase)
MQALKELFTTDVGILSTAVIVFTLGMGAFFTSYFRRHIAEDAARAAAEQR